MGTINMLGLAKRVRARMLLTSTSEVYGDPEQHPQTESYWGHVNPIGVRSCYDEGKRVAECLMMDYHRQNNVDIKIVRIFNTYGPRMAINDGRVVSNFCVAALRGEELPIYGDGKQTRSFAYVDDIIEALVRMMNARRTSPGRSISAIPTSSRFSSWPRSRSSWRAAARNSRTIPRGPTIRCAAARISVSPRRAWDGNRKFRCARASR